MFILVSYSFKFILREVTMKTIVHFTLISLLLQIVCLTEGIFRIKTVAQFNKNVLKNPNPVYVLFYNTWSHNEYYNAANTLKDYACSKPLFTTEVDAGCPIKLFSVDKDDKNVKDLPMIKDLKSNMDAMAFKNGVQIGNTVEGYSTNGNVPMEHKKLLDLAVGKEINNEYKWQKVYF